MISADAAEADLVEEEETVFIYAAHRPTTPIGPFHAHGGRLIGAGCRRRAGDPVFAAAPFLPGFSPFLLFPQLHPLSGRSFLALPIVPTISSFLLIFAWLGVFSIFFLLSRLSLVAFSDSPHISNIREDKENVNISYQTSDITVGPLIAKMYIIIAFASRRRLLFVCWRQPGILSLCFVGLPICCD